jgi:hypothetical protein
VTAVTSLDESGFRFEFGESWIHLVPWDQSPAFLRGIRLVQGTLEERPEGTKAVDFVGVRDHELWMLEIKDFRNRDGEWEKRCPELPLEIALKVRDTLAGIIGTHHQTGAEPWTRAAVAKLATTTPITVVAMIARPALWRDEPEAKHKMRNDVLMKQTRRLLAWLSRRVFVIDPMLSAELDRLPDLTVTSLAQAKHAQKK